jgi:hypothetical protein
MTEFVVSIFRLENTRGYAVPIINTGFRERDSGDEWNVVCGGTRAYITRSSGDLDKDLAEQSDDSHFVARRLVAALLLASAGLFQPKAMGRLVLWDINQDFKWTTHLDRQDPEAPDLSELIKAVDDWWTVLTQHTVLRRVAEDLHLALSQPGESLVFVYRGLEWIVKHFGIRWEDLATGIGVPFTEIRALKQLANDETGVRHGSKSGIKLRAMRENYGTWPCALVDAINFARQKLESSYTPMSPKEAALVVARAMSVVPYE